MWFLKPALLSLLELGVECMFLRARCGRNGWGVIGEQGVWSVFFVLFLKRGVAWNMIFF